MNPRWLLLLALDDRRGEKVRQNVATEPFRHKIVGYFAKPAHLSDDKPLQRKTFKQAKEIAEYFVK
jgi:hypothetical protein